MIIAIATMALMQVVPRDSATPLIALVYQGDVKLAPEVRFALYDDGTVIVDSRGAGRAIDLLSKHLSPTAFAEIKTALRPDPQFATLKSRYHVGNVPDAPVYQIIAKMDKGYKSVAIGGLLETGVASPFEHEPSIARATAPVPFVELLDVILGLRFDNMSPVQMRSFVVELYDQSLLGRDPSQECQWPSDWPTLDHATKVRGGYTYVDCYHLQLEGTLWPAFRDLERRCSKIVIGKRVFNARAYSRLPGSDLWLDARSR
jgi:hypothetical protein